MATDATYGPLVHHDGPNKITVEAAGEIDILASGKFSLAGTDIRAKLAALPVSTDIPTYPVGGIATGYKVARGLHTQLAASDTVVTGLATVVAVVACFGSVGPTVKQLHCSASIGDQAGAPAAGSILLKTWKPTSSTNDATPTAATDFSDNVVISWIAVGT